MLPAKALARSGLYSEKKLKTTVDDLDAWYRQHIQHDRKVSSSAMQMAFRKSDTCLPALSAHNPADQGEPFAQYLSIPGCSDTRDGLRRCTCENYSSLPKSVDNFKPRNSLPEGSQLTAVDGDRLLERRRKSFDPATDISGKVNRLSQLLHKLNPLSTSMNRTDAAKGATSGDACIAGQASNKIIRKPSRSPSHQKHDSGAKGEAPALACVKGGALVGGTGVLSGVSQAFSSSSSLHSQIAPASGGDEGTIGVAISVEDIDAVDGWLSRENDAETFSSLLHSDDGSFEGQGLDFPDSHRTRSTIEHLIMKISRTKDLIHQEQIQKEANVNEYLQLAANADRQQNQRIKNVFEKRNQKSAQTITHLQKKLESYQRRMQDVETHGVPGHWQAKEMLRDVGHGLKGVVVNIKGATDTIVSKPRVLAHLIKNRFGSADNIDQMKIDDGLAESVTRQADRATGTLPAGFKYSSDDDNSSVTSASGFGVLHSIPQAESHVDAHDAIQNVVSADEILSLHDDILQVKHGQRHIESTISGLCDDLDVFKSVTESELSVVRSLLDEEKFRVERLVEQVNDLTELHQHEMANVKQDMAAMEEKMEYRLGERTSDLSDLVDNCQARILRLEQQQLQQQQLLSMEMVGNVTFRTILTKLINVVLAVLAVVLVLVSTTTGLLTPFVVSRTRVVSTSVLVLAVSLLMIYGPRLIASLFVFWPMIAEVFPS